MEFFNDVGGDPSRPSIFELIAQEQLRDLLQPALKYVLSVFAQRYPRYILRIVNRHEEFYALLMLFVERHYLRVHGASFSENFYGLKRRRTPLYDTPRAKAAVGSSFSAEKLRKQDLRVSLLFLVMIPYLRAKAADYFEAIGGGVDPTLFEDVESESNSRSFRAAQASSWQWRPLYKKLYPWVNMCFEAWLLAYNVAYLFDKTAHYRPWLSWIGIDLRRLGPDDMPLPKPALTPDHLRRNLSLFYRLRRLILRSPRLLLDSLKVLLPTAIFFVKFLEWWYSPSSPARTIAAPPQGPLVPPPKLLLPHPDGVSVDRVKYGMCSLCQEPIANATATPSGYVFCYKCIHDHVEVKATCPVTLLPTCIWQLRRILI